MAQHANRRLAAIVSADVAGYSRLMGADEEGTLGRLKTLRAELIDPKIAEHGGRIVKTTGDGLLLEFSSVVGAVRCVVEVQTAMALRNANLPQDRRIEFRIGVNLGDMLIDGDDIFGDGVNVAARLQESAKPGGICVSSRVHDDVRDRLDLGFDDGGEQSLKNIARPVRIWQWNAAAPSSAAMDPAGPALPLPEKPSIAVLPFANMSGDPEQEYFADGIAEDVIILLSKSRALFVIARNSSFTYKGRAVDVKQVGRELGVRYVLEGSVRKAGNRVRVTGQLIEAAIGGHLWAERYDRDLTDIFAVQDEITASVSAAILPTMERSERERAARKPPDSLRRVGMLPPRDVASGQGRSRRERLGPGLLRARDRARPRLCRGAGGDDVCHSDRRCPLPPTERAAGLGPARLRPRAAQHRARSQRGGRALRNGVRADLDGPARRSHDRGRSRRRPRPEFRLGPCLERLHPH